MCPNGAEVAGGDGAAIVADVVVGDCAASGAVGTQRGTMQGPRASTPGQPQAQQQHAVQSTLARARVREHGARAWAAARMFAHRSEF